MVCIELNAQMVKEIKRRMCRFDTAIGTFFKFFVTLGFVMLLGVGCVSASTLVVSKTSPACTFGDEYFTSIQAAVDSAKDGDEIVVCPGTYVENVIVDKNLTIRSENGPDSTIVRAAYTEDAVFEVTADYVGISGFMVNGATKGWLASGIHLHYADYCNISNNNCSNNSNGIYADYSRNNIITDNICSKAKNGGIFLGGSNNNHISSNFCYNNWRGICIMDSNNNRISNNICSNNGHDIGIQKTTN
jgi:parallel beta-helix repeat protein